MWTSILLRYWRWLEGMVKPMSQLIAQRIAELEARVLAKMDADKATIAQLTAENESLKAQLAQAPDETETSNALDHLSAALDAETSTNTPAPA